MEHWHKNMTKMQTKTKKKKKKKKKTELNIYKLIPSYD